ncbi:hypothetical protein J4N46_11500 [Capnocytophaga sp. Marseille-Q4570]|uniref:Uncharacterized protein n=1 Tax=Capnocytophaga bilenii TaxID=2819369 RepID=A0ABS3Q0D0_9FLAO|nr:hypothetical protein [Capnocytophaga bilenii]
MRAVQASHTQLRQLGASRTGFYPSVRAARAFILRCEPHRLLSFAYPSLILRLSFAYPSLILRSTFGEVHN